MITTSLPIAEAASVQATQANQITVQEVLKNMQLEIAFLVFFILGYVILRLDKVYKARVSRTGSQVLANKHKIIRSHYQSEDLKEVRKAWLKLESAKYDCCAPLDVLRMAVHATFETGNNPGPALEQMMNYVRAFPNAARTMPRSERPEYRARPKTASAGNTMIMNAMLQVVLSRASPEKFIELSEAVMNGISASHDEGTFEVMLAGHAGAGNLEKVDELTSMMKQWYDVVSPRAFCVIVEGFLSCGNHERVMSTLEDMTAVGCMVPQPLLAELLRQNISTGKLFTFFDYCKDNCPSSFSAESMTVLLEYATMHNDTAVAEQVEKLCTELNIVRSYPMYDALIKFYAKNMNPAGIEAFDMMTSTFNVQEGTCVAFMCACADSRFIRFAEHVFNFRKSNDNISVPILSAMMKSYAAAKRFGDACDLYPLMIEKGITPDARMVGCLMSFASRAGRTDLMDTLGQFQEGIQPHHLARIRGCRATKDSAKACKVLDEMRELGCVDAQAGNATLDVYVAAGEMEMAVELFEELKEGTIYEEQDALRVGYNIIIKGHCNNFRVDKARELVAEMHARDLQPNNISFNCMLNALVIRQSYTEAWDTYNEMRELGVDEDAYTVSTLIKGIKHCHDETFCSNVLQLLDNTKVDPTRDEIYLVVMLDVFSKRRDLRRLKRIMEKVKERNLSPTIATINAMLKAFSSLKMLDEAKALWHEMIEVRALAPTDISIGCMVDALVSNGELNEAVILVKSLKNRAQMNTIIYSTLIKGFAIARDAVGAHEVYALLKEEGFIPNLVTINTLIDASARGKRMDLCEEILSTLEEYDITPDRITYSTIVKGFCIAGDLTKAMAVLEPMRRQGLKPDLTVFNTLIDGCAGSDSYSLCDQVFAQMEREAVAPSNYTLTVMIKRHGREGKVNAAFDLVDRVTSKYGFAPSAQALTCLITACLFNKQLPRAIQVLERMRTEGPAPDKVTYEKVISGCLRSHVPEKACQFVLFAYGIDEKAKAGTEVSGLDESILVRIVDQLTQKGLVDSHAIPLVQKLRAANVVLPHRLVSATLCGAMKKHTQERKEEEVTEDKKQLPWLARKGGKGKGK